MIARRIRTGWLAVSQHWPFWLVIRPIGLVERGEDAAIGPVQDELGDMGDLGFLVVYRPADLHADQLDEIENALAGLIEPQARFVAVEIAKASSRHFVAGAQDFEELLGALVTQPLRKILRPDERIVHGTISSDRRRAALDSAAAWRRAFEAVKRRRAAPST